MAIEKNNVKVVAGTASRLDAEFSVGSRSRESMSSDEDELLCRRDAVESVDDEEFDDADSGAGSDDFDLLELGETGSEFCQVGDQTCCIPFELYDLPDLHGVLSLDVWNECLTEEEKFSLTKYLPDTDQETFMRTLKELFAGGNFHFGNPIDQLYQMLKGGFCEPRVALYRQGLNFFQIHQHYHLLRKHHDSMVSSLLQMREAWQNCKGYSIEEKLRVLNIMKSQKSLLGERNEDMGSDYSEREEPAEATWNMRLKGGVPGQKVGRDPYYGTTPAVEVFSQGRSMAGDSTRGSKANGKGLIKKAGSKFPLQNELAHCFRHGQSIKMDPYGSESFLLRAGQSAAYNAMAGSGDDEQGRMYEMASQRDWNTVHGTIMDQGRFVKSGNKRQSLRGDDYGIDSYSSRHPSGKVNFSGQGRNANVNQLSDIKVLTAKPSNVRGFYDPAKRAKYVEPMYENHMASVKRRAPSKGNLANFSAYFPDDPSFTHGYRDGNSRKMKLGREFSDPRTNTVKALGSKMEDRVCHPEKRAKIFQDNARGVPVRNGGSSTHPSKRGRMLHGGEDTESDSSDQIEEEGDNGPAIMPGQALHGQLENSRPSHSGSVFDKNERRTKRGVKGSTQALDDMLPASNTMADYGRHMQRQEIESIYLKSRQTANAQHLDTLHNFTSRFSEDYFYGSLGNPDTESNRMPAYKVLSNGQVQPDLTGVSMSVNNAFPTDRRLRGNVVREAFLRQSKNMRDHYLEEGGGLYEGSPLGGSGRDFDGTLLGCTSSVKKHKRKDNLVQVDEHDGSDYMEFHQPALESIPVNSRGKKRQGDLGSPDAELPVAEARVEDSEVEVKPQKKPSPPITPTVHTGFSFSVIHLLSAVRIALIAPMTEESSKEAQKPPENPGTGLEDQNLKHEHANGSTEQIDVNNPALPEQTGAPSLTVHEIVNRVRSSPGDPCILETQEPLQDLVRGVLKIFSSKTAPLGAKSWKPLICYDKSRKSWSWTGSTTQNSTDNEPPEEVTSPEAWKIPRKMLVKLVDSFANWLKSGQETLRQIGSLPAPPAELLQLHIDEKERFRDLRAQKSLITISPSSDEVRAYFRKEEILRYSVPDRAFCYTAADGKKSIVAPLRRCGGKPTSKARDHFMLKKDRPPHVTILCLVRDAAARLPGSIGTRADVCTLIRDSQYIVEDVGDEKVNGVVSGALDRLHYERDPCVLFDGEKKLWVYLHREREEEDFEDDGTSSTKKWKRQKKDAVEQDEQVTVAHPDSVERSGLDLGSDLNAELPCTNNEKLVEVTHDDTRQRSEDDLKASGQGAGLEIGPYSLENYKNEDLDNESKDSV